METSAVKKFEYGFLPERELDDDELAVDCRLSSVADRRKSTSNSYLSLLIGSVAGVIIGFFCGQLKAGPSPQSFRTNPQIPIPKEIFSNRHNVPFNPYPEYMGPSEEVARNWAQLTKGISINGGPASDSIYLDDPSAYGLQDPGIRAPFFIFNEPPPVAKSLHNINNFYVLNSIHELHCVNMIRMRYNSLVYHNADPLADTPIDKDWITHVEHCFEYLRLSITCADYMTLESDSPPGSPEEFWKEGLSWGVVHSCIDWDGLMRFQEDRVIAYNRTWS